MSNPPAYEVSCQFCSVTFPIGTKHCIHCGERIGRAPLFQPTAGEDGMPVLQEAEPYELTEAADEAEEAPRKWRGMRVGITLLWLVLAAALRVCRGEG
ncbi:MAG: hypothetical protein JRH10_13730 [Deltaproteobacteria bacterium]|nr:hypothetical protein [Deltaproteobacteria bacterium]MBW2447395.1 hypothetical protein [Deltaproteobacteria bacterium]